MSENGEIYTAGKKFYTPAGTDGMDKFHLCSGGYTWPKCILCPFLEYVITHQSEVEFVHPVTAGGSVKFLPAV